MSEVESPPPPPPSPSPRPASPQRSPERSTPDNPSVPGRISSPKKAESAMSKMRADQMDALPPVARTPRKTATTPVSARLSTHVELQSLSRLSDVSEPLHWSALFSQKIAQCMVIFDFSLPSHDLRNKELKTVALKDILATTCDHPSALAEQQYQEIINMFSHNVFRAIPPGQNPVGDAFNPEDDDPVYDPSWPHIHLVYEIFIRLVESSSFNVNLARKHIDQHFVHRLLALFDMEDPRERDLIKTAVHRVYGKFLNLRALIRKAMRHIFYEFVYENERHNIAEMLEILGSVVNGFAVPLREEHKIFLERTLIPLHKNRSLPLYYSQLSLCIVQFAEKDSTLVQKIILGLLRQWPKTNTIKEIMLLNEIEEILDVTPQEHFVHFLVPLMRQLARSIGSPHFQVAERALHYWNNEYIVSIVALHCDLVMPIVLPAMLHYSRAHWNKNVQLQVFNGLRTFMDLNPRLYEKISTSSNQASPHPHSHSHSHSNCPSQASREQRWARVEAAAVAVAAAMDTTRSPELAAISKSPSQGARNVFYPQAASQDSSQASDRSIA